MNKEIKISASVDDVSFSKAKTKISELVQEMKKLVDLSKEVNLGGIVGVGGGRSQAGAGSAARRGQGQQNQQFSVGGVDNLTKSAAAFKNAGDSARTALKGMSDAFKEHVGVSTREGQRLVKEIGDLEKGLDRLHRKAASLKGTSALSGILGEHSQAERESIMPAWRRRLSMTNRFGAGASDLYQSELASIQSPFGRAMSHVGQGGFWNKAIPGTPQMPGAQNSFLARTLGITGGVGLGVLGGVGAVGAAANFAMNQRHDQQVTALDYQANHLPFLAASRRATAGQVFGGTALAIKQGDLARAGALRGLGSDKNFTSLLGDQRQGYQKFAIDKATSTEFWQNPTFGNARGQFSSWVGGGSSRMMDFLGGAEIPGLTTQQANEIRNRMQKDFVGSRGAEDVGKMIDLKMQEDPVANALKNNLWGSAHGDLGMARAAGLSGGLRNRRNRRALGGWEKYDTISDFNKRAQDTLYTGGEIAGHMGSVLQAAGSRGGVGTNAALMNAAAGGLGNATALFGHGAQFGASGFYGGFQRMMGGGGVGGVAGSHIGGAVMNAMNAGNFAGFDGPGAGLGFAQTMMDATMTGNAGTDIRRARQVQGGLGAMGSMMSGGIDPLQQALNMSAALKAAPGGNYSAHKGLMDMDPATMMEVLSPRGQVPDWMRARGITKDMVKRYADSQNATAISRFSDTMGEGSEMGAAASRYRSAGGTGYMKGWSQKRKLAEANTLAEIIKDTTGVSRDDARGRMYLQLGIGEKGRARGGGVGAALDRGSTRAQIMRKQGEMIGEDGKAIVAASDTINDDVGSTTGTVGALEGGRRAAQRSASGSPEEALAGVQVAFTQLIAALRGISVEGKGPARAQPPKP